jgi:2-oxo-3-hexenedioate decarboxylase
VAAEKNGEVVSMATCAERRAILGGSGDDGQTTRRARTSCSGRTFIMIGGVARALRVDAGDNIEVRFQNLGTVSMCFV